MALTAEQLKAYLQGLAKERGFDEARTGKLTALIEGEGDLTLSRAELKEILAPIVEHPLARHADYSKAMDGVTKKAATYDEWYTKQALPAVQAAQKAATDAQAKLAAYEKQYGNLEDTEDLGGGRGRTPSGDIVDMNKVNDLVAASKSGLAKEFLSFELDRDRITREHFNKFKELPSITQLMDVIREKSTGEKALTLDDAYNEVYGTKVQEFSAAEENKRIQAEVDKRLAAERARRPSTPSGAALPENQGDFFLHHSSAQKGEVKLPSEAELESAFTADLTTELAKSDATQQ